MDHFTWSDCIERCDLDILCGCWLKYMQLFAWFGARFRKFPLIKLYAYCMVMSLLDDLTGKEKRLFIFNWMFTENYNFFKQIRMFSLHIMKPSKLTKVSFIIIEKDLNLKLDFSNFEKGLNIAAKNEHFFNFLYHNYVSDANEKWEWLSTLNIYHRIFYQISLTKIDIFV